MNPCSLIQQKVFDLLEAIRKQKLNKSLKALGKKADIYYEDPYPFSGVFHIAVESKYYLKILGISQFSGILRDYELAQGKNV